jgi:NADH-quinone oxidoreductase subunit L
VDEAYDALFVRPFFATARWTGNMLERGVDGLVNGVALTLREASRGLRDLQTGYVRNYALVLLAGAVLVVAYVLYAGGRG